MTKLSVVILSWNRKEDTTDTVESLIKSKIKGFTLEIVVVDNGSTDGSPKALRKLLGNIANSPSLLTKLIELDTNLGFSEGNNVGFKYALKAKADYVVLLNDDTLVDNNLMLNLIKAAKKYKKAGAITPKIYFAPGFEFHKDRYKKKDLGKVIWYAGGDIDWDNIYATNHGVDEVDRGQYDKAREVDFATGCCLLLKKDVLEKVGLFDKKYFAYLEDADLSQRIKKAGWKVLYVPSGYLWHKVSQSSGIGSELNDYFITRNRLLFGMRYARLRAKTALIRESLRLLISGRKWQKIGVRDFYLGHFGRGSWK